MEYLAVRMMAQVTAPNSASALMRLAAGRGHAPSHLKVARAVDGDVTWRLYRQGHRSIYRAAAAASRCGDPLTLIRILHADTRVGVHEAVLTNPNTPLAALLDYESISKPARTLAHEASTHASGHFQRAELSADAWTVLTTPGQHTRRAWAWWAGSDYLSAALLLAADTAYRTHIAAATVRPAPDEDPVAAEHLLSQILQNAYRLPADFLGGPAGDLLLTRILALEPERCGRVVQHLVSALPKVARGASALHEWLLAHGAVNDLVGLTGLDLEIYARCVTVLNSGTADDKIGRHPGWDALCENPSVPDALLGTCPVLRTREGVLGRLGSWLTSTFGDSATMMVVAVELVHTVDNMTFAELAEMLVLTGSAVAVDPPPAHSAPTPAGDRSVQVLCSTAPQNSPAALNTTGPADAPCARCAKTGGLKKPRAAHRARALPGQLTLDEVI